MYTFEYPAVTPTETLTLKSPMPGEKIKQPSKVAIKVSMNNIVRAFRTKQDLGEFSQLRFRLEYPDMKNALQFFKNAEGKYFKVTTEDGEVFTAIISAQDVTSTVAERGKRTTSDHTCYIDLNIRRWV